MGFPSRVISAGAGLTSLALSYLARSSSKTYFARNFVLLWLAEVLVWGFYRAILWPYFLSPLRTLPEPPNSHWLHGQGPRIFRDAPGVPMRDWCVWPSLCFITQGDD